VTGHGVSGRGWAYVGTVLGAGVSVCANVAHSYVPPACAPVSAGGVSGECVPWTPPTDWAPPIVAVAGSALWPILVVVAVEILTRVDWPADGRWLAARWCGLLPVALVAAVISYVHGYGLLRAWGESQLAAALGPLAPDGLMVIASSALLIRRTRDTPDVAGTDTPPVSVPVAVEVAVRRPVPVLAVSAPVTPPCPDTAPERTAVPVPVPRHAKAAAAAACASTPRAVHEHVSVTTTPDTDTDEDILGGLIHVIAGTTDTELADTLRVSGTCTLRGAMKELGVGQARARRVLALAWPDPDADAGGASC